MNKFQRDAKGAVSCDALQFDESADFDLPVTGEDSDLRTDAALVSFDGMVVNFVSMMTGSIGRNVAGVEVVIGGAGSWDWIGIGLRQVGVISVDGGMDEKMPTAKVDRDDLTALDVIMASWARSDLQNDGIRFPTGRA